MLQLDSKKIETVRVSVRGEDAPIIMSTAKGMALMEYLTKDSPGSHVMITDVDGAIITVSRHEITKIMPIYNQKINLQELDF